MAKMILASRGNEGYKILLGTQEIKPALKDPDTLIG